MITGKSTKRASETIKGLSTDLSGHIGILKINGKGKPTPVATAQVLIDLVWDLPGKAARLFRRQSAHMICRILGGDMSLVTEIEKRFNDTPRKRRIS